VIRRELFHEPAHAAVADQQGTHLSSSTARAAPPRRAKSL
jgi:hypothetical protein